MNKTMFWIGIVITVISAILLLGNFMGDNTSPIILGIIGIVFIATSNYRPMKKKK